jgi:DNA polymerase-3 subunit alpha
LLLNCHTYYSLRYGTLSIEELLNECLSSGHRRIVLSDINNTSAVLEALRISGETGISVIPGIDFRNGIQQKYIGIAKNNAGFKELNEHLSSHLHSDNPFAEKAPTFKDAFVVYPFKGFHGQSLDENEFVGIQPTEIPRLRFHALAKHPEKLVILQPVTFVHKKHFNAHRLLRAIAQNTLLSKLPAAEQASEDERARSRVELEEIFSDFPDAIINTEKILNNCSVHFEFGKLSNKNLRFYTGSAEGDADLLRTKAYEGLAYRYPDRPENVIERVEKELAVINRMNFASYFLINWDIVTYARSRNYFYVGRGSGANSIVAYLLLITDVDPIDLDLYFERFINEHRSNAPDFDIDFSWNDRDDITRYIFERFGKQRTALLGSYSTFQRDAVLRELGKVFGLPPSEIDRLQQYKRTGEADQVGKLVLQYSELIQGFPSHLSIHASGIIISEEPVTAYTATFMPPKGYPTTQFSMLEAEDIGLFKFDILSQRGLGKIKDAVELVSRNQQVEIDIHDINSFKKDEAIRELLKVGKCIGCFYVESPAMRMLLAKLRADDYLRLVAASSIIRPGVSKSGMMREYIVRYRKEELRERARKQLPELYALLEETYGVMVYQEDVIKIAHLFADLTLAEADYLRRGMSWKFKQRNEFWKVREKFFGNCARKGYSEKTINDIWTQIESFANFAFSKGHSASYAVESYQALYLKAHFPLEYMVATLNNGGGYYRKELYIHEARMHGAKILPPCVNTSDGLCVIRDKQIYLGLGMVSGLEDELTARILRERNNEGEFKGLYDFVRRVSPGIEQLRLLIRAGAFLFCGIDKKKLLWEAHMMINPQDKKKQSKGLFDIEPETFVLPELEHSWLDDAYDEMELFGFTLCSPFDLLKEKSESRLSSKQLQKFIGKKIEIMGYLVSVKNTGSSDGRKMHFGTFLDTEGSWIDTVHFPDSARDQPFSGPGCYVIQGIVGEEFDFTYVEVSGLRRLPVLTREDAVSQPA